MKSWASAQTAWTNSTPGTRNISSTFATGHSNHFKLSSWIINWWQGLFPELLCRSWSLFWVFWKAGLQICSCSSRWFFESCRVYKPQELATICWWFFKLLFKGDAYWQWASLPGFSHWFGRFPLFLAKHLTSCVHSRFTTKICYLWALSKQVQPGFF